MLSGDETETIIDFDEIHKLYKEDPKKCQEYCDLLMEKQIDKMTADPERRKALKQYQWQLAGELRKCNTQQERIDKMWDLFMKGFNDLNNVLNNYEQFVSRPNRPNKKSGNLIPLKKDR